MDVSRFRHLYREAEAKRSLRLTGLNAGNVFGLPYGRSTLFAPRHCLNMILIKK